jgi:transposase
MRDTELYRRILGLESPWDVARVELAVKEHRVDVWVEHPPKTRWQCPECGRELATHDHHEERAWRHLDTMQFRTYLHARPPRVDCPEHGLLQVKLPWAEPMSRFTALFERLAVDVLKECDVQGAAKILRLSWDEAWHLAERAVRRGVGRQKSVRPRGGLAMPPLRFRVAAPNKGPWAARTCRMGSLPAGADERLFG